MRGGLVAIFLIFFWSGSLSAQASGISFSWVRGEGAASCASASELRREVSRRLGYRPFTNPSDLFLEGIVQRSDDGWTVKLFKRDDAGALDGVRELSSQAPDCRALGDAIALAVALAIDPTAALAPPPDDANPEASEVPESADVPDVPDVPAERRPTPSRSSTSAPALGLRVSLGAAAVYKLVPGWGFGGRITLDGPIAGALRWSGNVLYLPEQVAERDGARFGVGLTTLGLGLCVGARSSRLSVDGCAHIDVGGLHVVVYDPTPTAPGDRVYVGGTLTVRGGFRLWRRLWLGVSLGASIPFVDYDFRVEGQPDEVFSPSPVAPSGSVELQVDFGPH